MHAAQRLPAELINLDQLKVLLDALPDYIPDEPQPSYVLAIPCRPIVSGLAVLFPGMRCLAQVSWASLLTHAAGAASFGLLGAPSFPSTEEDGTRLNSPLAWHAGSR